MQWIPNSWTEEVQKSFCASEKRYITGTLQVARVTLLDAQGAKRDYLASVAGLLRSKDLAVLKIEAPASILQPAAIGTSADVRVGQQVLAIGNPFGFDHTLTTGAVSGLDRVIQSQVGTSTAHACMCAREGPAVIILPQSTSRAICYAMECGKMLGGYGGVEPVYQSIYQTKVA